VNADFQYEITAKTAHCFAHAQRRCKSAVGRRKSRHYRIADGLHDGTPFRGDDLVKRTKMRLHQIICDEIANAVIEFGEPFRSVKRKVRLVIFSR
jgi:hypothetical protein